MPIETAERPSRGVETYMVKAWCDRCGNECSRPALRGRTVPMQVEILARPTLQTNHPMVEHTFVLCHDCADEFRTRFLEETS